MTEQTGEKRPVEASGSGVLPDLATLNKEDAKLELQKRPLCIICGRPSEAKVIAEAFGIENNRLSGQNVEDVHNSHTFYLGSFQGRQKVDYYITSSLRQGIQSFAIHASILFQSLKPQYAVHAGVCASYSGLETLKLRDVIFAEGATLYEEGKYVRRGNEVHFEGDLENIRNPAGDMQAFVRERKGYHYGDFISGSAVREDAKDVFEAVRPVARNAIGLDMEASAFLKLCAHLEVQSLGVVKGISDFGDAMKGKDPTAYDDALCNTALALKEWCIHSITKVEMEPNPDLQPGGQLADGYYHNFLRTAIDSLSMADAGITLQDRTVPHKEIKGFMVVLPKDYKVESFVEGGQINAITKQYGLVNGTLGNENFKRTLHYKAGYVVDFPRTINTLASRRAPSFQLRMFHKALLKKPYFSTPPGNLDVKVMPWESFLSWLEEAEKADAEKSGDPDGSLALDDHTRGRTTDYRKPPITAQDGRKGTVRRDELRRTPDRMRSSPTEWRASSQHGPHEYHGLRRAHSQTPWHHNDEEATVAEEDDDSDFEPPPNPPPPEVPPGWRAKWSDDYNTYFFVNIYTRISTWKRPTYAVYPPRGDSPSPLMYRHTAGPPGPRGSSRA